MQRIALILEIISPQFFYVFVLIEIVTLLLGNVQGNILIKNIILIVFSDLNKESNFPFNLLHFAKVKKQHYFIKKS